VNYVYTYVTSLVSYFLGLVVSPEEGNTLLPKRSVLFWVFCDGGKSSSKCRWYYL